MLKKFGIILNTIILIIGMYSSVNAESVKRSLNVVQKASETKYLENDQGYISKAITESNSDKGEVTLELKLSNTKRGTEQAIYDSTEVIFVIDNSASMEEKVEGETTRRDVVISSAKSLASSLFQDIANLKIGLVYYYGFDMQDGSPVLPYGTLDTAKVLSELTDDADAIQEALTSFSDDDYGNGTNTDAGLQRAKSMFSSSNSSLKFVILLSDGVPVQAVGVSVYSGSYPGQNEMQAEVNEHTKETILSLEANDINLITMLTGLESLESNEKIIEEDVFGTMENPTAGQLYNINDTDIETVIKEKIYKEVLEKVQNPINTVKIIDYFPNEIIENFDFSYVGEPSVGTISGTIDKNNKSFTWDIGNLKGNEVATLRYKLKIKDMQNKELLNKIISTNEKLVLTYKDTKENDYTVNIASSPKIQLVETKVTNPKPTTPGQQGSTQGGGREDPTTANGNLPKTGSYTPLAIVGVATIILVAIIAYKKYSDYKDTK